MKLRFGIIWVEDNLTQEMKEIVEASAASAGFEGDITNVKNREELQNCSVEQNKYHTYDLVLIDWDLGDVEGDEFVKEVRELFSFTPILFYSGQIGIKDLRQKITDKEVDGVFCTNRNQLFAQTDKLIGVYAKPLDRLSGMRGLGAQVVAEIDNLYQEMILKLIGENEEEEKIAVEYLKEQINEQQVSVTNKTNKFSEITSFLDDPATDSMKLFKLFRHLLKRHVSSGNPNDPKISEISSLNKSIVNYGRDVLGVRNLLSHSLEDKTEDGWVITDKNGNKITTEDFSDYRSTFIEYLKNLNRLRDLLVSPEE